MTAGPRYFFLVGTPRSGTTLLQAMLMRAPGVYIPPETKFLEITWHNRRYVGDLRQPAAWARARDEVLRIVADDGIPLDPQAFRARLERAPRDHAGMFRALLDSIAEQRDATWIGEKSPVHTQYVVKLLEMFPEARVIQILRDPRDVALSQREVWGTSALQASLRWRRDARKHEAYAATLDRERYAWVRYEDLVREAEATLRRLCGFLGFEFDPRMLEPQHRREPGFAPQERHKLRTLEPLTADRVGRHRREQRAIDRAVVERVCRRPMRRLGYEPSGASGPAGLLGVLLQAPVVASEHARRHAALLHRRFRRPRGNDHAGGRGEA